MDGVAYFSVFLCLQCDVLLSFRSVMRLVCVLHGMFTTLIFMVGCYQRYVQGNAMRDVSLAAFTAESVLCFELLHMMILRTKAGHQ